MPPRKTTRSTVALSAASTSSSASTTSKTRSNPSSRSTATRRNNDDTLRTLRSQTESETSSEEDSDSGLESDLAVVGPRSRAVRSSAKVGSGQRVARQRKTTASGKDSTRAGLTKMKDGRVKAGGRAGERGRRVGGKGGGRGETTGDEGDEEEREGRAAEQNSSDDEDVKTPTRPTARSNVTIASQAAGTKGKMPNDQIETFLENYDLETATRLDRLRSELAFTLSASLTRMKLVLDRIPRAVRDLPLSEFVDEYGADIHAFMGRAPTAALEEGRKEWEMIKEQSPKKKRRGADDDDGNDHEAEGGKASNKGRGKRGKTSKVDAPPVSNTTAGRPRKTRPSRLASASHGPRSAMSPALSPRPKTTSSASTSTTPFPTLSAFSPSLPSLATPKPPTTTTTATAPPRAAQPGEIVSYLSLNGSPICGVIGKDGVVRPMSFLGSDPTVAIPVPGRRTRESTVKGRR